MAAARLAVSAALLLLLAWPAGADAATKRSSAVPRAFQIATPCPAIGKPTGACPGWIRDHIIPRGDLVTRVLITRVAKLVA